jgi:uncharacterized protein (TIGR00251 family)
MRHFIRVIPRAKQNKVVVEEDRLKVYLTAPAIEGRANEALIKILAAHFQVRKGDIRIVKGEKSRDKIIQIGNPHLSLGQTAW